MYCPIGLMNLLIGVKIEPGSVIRQTINAQYTQSPLTKGVLVNVTYVV